MGGIFPYLYSFFVNIVYILTLESNFYFYFFHVKLQGTTKEAFVAYAIPLVLEHRQLFIHHHGTETIETITKYHTIMGIPSSSSS
jgi:hypothetical protein